MSAGSTTESAAILDVLARLKLIEPTEHKEGKQVLNRIMAMLVKLTKGRQ